MSTPSVLGLKKWAMAPWADRHGVQSLAWLRVLCLLCIPELIFHVAAPGRGSSRERPWGSGLCVVLQGRDRRSLAALCHRHTLSHWNKPLFSAASRWGPGQKPSASVASVMSSGVRHCSSPGPLREK
jgi:hypothetical protein